MRRKTIPKQKAGDKYGIHRVLEPLGVLPQPAERISNNMDEIYDNEILIDVQTLNIDSASFMNIRIQAQDDPKKIKEIICDLVKKQGKLRNPWTGSGGMLVGKVEQIGEAIRYCRRLRKGDRIATLVSLSLTPLRIDRIKAIHPLTAQVDISGKAILFESGLYADMPYDLPERLALAVLDVAGAPAQTAKMVKPGDNVLVLGAGGKSGMLCCYEARKRAGTTGTVIGLCYPKESARRLEALGLCDYVLVEDATRPVSVKEYVRAYTNGEMCDVVINTVNVPDTETTAILCAKPTGTVYFFSMATNFTKAALGAEGVGSDVTMIIGNGYTKGHAEIALNVLRECEPLRKVFTELYADEKTEDEDFFVPQKNK